MDDDLYELAGESTWETRQRRPAAQAAVAEVVLDIEDGSTPLPTRDRDIDVVPLLARIERELRALRSFHNEESIRLRIHELNKRLSHANPHVISPLLPLDIDRVVDRWRRDRGAGE